MRGSSYISRVLDEELQVLLKAVPALALEGPKGVGKTESAARLAATIRRLDVPAELSVVAADPNLALEGLRPVLIDEWQRFTPIWDAIKRDVDDGAEPGSYLLTGSATPGDSATHSGAGRIVTIRMRPLSSLGQATPSAIRRLPPRTDCRCRLRRDGHASPPSGTRPPLAPSLCRGHIHHDFV
jgi:predicted AAA+ superfamily ATPase